MPEFNLLIGLNTLIPVTSGSTDRFILNNGNIMQFLIKFKQRKFQFALYLVYVYRNEKEKRGGKMSHYVIYESRLTFPFGLLVPFLITETVSTESTLLIFHLFNSN